MNGETDMQRLARYVRQRRRELGITSAPRLDVLMMNEIESWYPGKAQYLETKQSEIPSSEELKALARVLQTTVTELLYVAGLLDNSDHVIPTVERRRERTGAH